MVIEIRKCQFCGKEFAIEDVARKNQVYCTDKCRNDNRNMIRREEKRERQLQSKNKKPNDELIKYTVKAHNNGMTYGELYTKEHAHFHTFGGQK